MCCLSTENRRNNTTSDKNEDDIVLNGNNNDNDSNHSLQKDEHQYEKIKDIQRSENPLKSASFISKAFFSWPYPLLKLGMERPLEDTDIPDIMDIDKSSNNRIYLETLWKKELLQNPQNPRLEKVILKDFFTSLWYVQPALLAAAIAKVLQAISLYFLLETFESDNNIDTNNNTRKKAYMWATVLIMCVLVILFEHHHVFFATWRRGMQYRIAAVAAIYHKSLRLSSTNQQTSASYGKIMNLASNDVERFLLASLFTNHLLWSPLQSIAILIVGCRMLGPAFAAGFVLLFAVFVPLQYYLSKKFMFYRKKIAGITDQRVNFVSQAIQGTRVMKMSGYEARFIKRIADLRKQEVKHISNANYLRAINEATFYCSNVVISIIIFLVHIHIFNGTLKPGTVFAVFTLVNVLQIEMTKHVSLGIMGVSECYISIKRIQEFLMHPELPMLISSSSDANDDNNNENGNLQNNGDNDSKNNSDNDCLLSMKNVTCYWNDVKHFSSPSSSPENIASPTTLVNNMKEDKQDSSSTAATLSPALTDITATIQKNELVCVIGPVGSGKSAFLQAIIGELPESSKETQKSSRIIRNYKSIAYASQDPWIMNGTIKENILMGQNYNHRWYETVVQCCCLTLDFVQLINGDNTVVGDKGVQISGGQRARIGLARAIYLDTELLILDDPLSAVDAKVGKQLFDNAIVGLMINSQRNNKKPCTVILATHQHQYIYNNKNEYQYKCILFIDGRISYTGNYTDCITASNGKLKAQSNDTSVDIILAEKEGNDDDEKKEYEYNNRQSSVGAKEEKDDDDDNDEKKSATETKKKKKINTDTTAGGTNKESTVKGLVRFDTYLNYMRAMGGIYVGIFLFIVFCLTQGSVLVSIAMIGKWAERPPLEQYNQDIIWTIVGLGCFVVIFALFRALIFFIFTVKASQRLHDRMTEAVIRSKIEFFDTNPLGRILNRFSADVGSNDDLLPYTLYDFLGISFVVFGAVATTVVVLPFTLIIFPPLILYFIWVRRIFVTSTRELKRLEGLARSPIFSMLGESLGGIATIRGNNAMQFFANKFETVHDNHSRAVFSFIASSRWVGFRMDSILLFFTALVTYTAVLFQTMNWFQVDPTILGLSLSMLLQLAGIFQWCIRQSAEVVNQMVSVERVLDFSELEPEADLVKDSDKQLLPMPKVEEDDNCSENIKYWPNNGCIDVKELSVRYRSDLPLVLDKVSFSIPGGGKRVGVVGRTGSGKSTIVQTLFRLLEPENGSIVIDGVDISKLGLHTLRTRIGVIPQSPTLFSGCSVRENLDLFSLHSDESISKALHDAHMHNHVMNELPNGWDTLVSENGSNFSVGQRQLLCLARAILNKNKILVLDEATASVDRRTDEMLQETLKKSFQNSTIIAIAHRLDTVIDSDYIIVLGGGKVLEFGTPAELLSVNEEGNRDGVFANMVKDTGEAMCKELTQRARMRDRQQKEISENSINQNDVNENVNLIVNDGNMNIEANIIN